MELNCEIAGAFALLSYSVFMVLPSGIFCLIIYTLAAFYKLSHLVTALLCPIVLLRIKHRWRGISTSNYDRYNQEFDFEVDV